MIVQITKKYPLNADLPIQASAMWHDEFVEFTVILQMQSIRRIDCHTTNAISWSQIPCRIFCR